MERALGLANGYMSYMTTADEYQLQAYHGGSTLYGRESSQYFSYAFGCLARHLEGYDGARRDDLDYVPPKCGPHLIGQARAFKYKTGPQRERLWTEKRDRRVRECALQGQGKETLPVVACKYEEDRCEEERTTCEALKKAWYFQCRAQRQCMKKAATEVEAEACERTHGCPGITDCPSCKACQTEQAICRLPQKGESGTEESSRNDDEGEPPAFCFRWRDRGPYGVMGDRDPYSATQDEDWLVRAVATKAAPGAPMLFEFASEPLISPREPLGTSLTELRSRGQTAIDDRGIAFTTQVIERRRGAWEWSTVFRPSSEQWKILKDAGVPHLEVRQFSQKDDEVKYLRSKALDEVPVCTAETLREYCLIQ